jgi:hypothetical protein
LHVHSDPLSTKEETKSHDGVVHGGYSYVDAYGHVQSVKYVADPHNGFQIVAATNLPKGPSPAVHSVAPHYNYNSHLVAPLPVEKLPEVVAAERAHLAAVEEVKARHHHHKRSVYGFAPAPAPINGVPVDTAEVQHEKAQHFAAVQRALAGQPANPLIYTPQLAYKSYDAPSYNQYSAPSYNQYSAPAKAYNHHDFQPAPAPINGVPIETQEVQHLKAKHLAVVAAAESKAASSSNHYSNGHEDDGSYDARRYENEYYH